MLFQEEHERPYKALCFVTGNRHDAEELMQDAFLRLWERWSELQRIQDPQAYLFRVALNGVRNATSPGGYGVSEARAVSEARDGFLDAEMRADVGQLLLGRLFQEPLDARRLKGVRTRSRRV